MNYATGDDGSPTGTPGVDYLAKAGSVKFSPGQTIEAVAVKVIGDRVPELTEYFALILSGASNAT